MKQERMLFASVFLIGIILLLESTATLFVLIENPASAVAVAWIYLILKILVSLFALITGYFGMKTKGKK